MGLKEIKSANRIIFLRIFVEEMLSNMSKVHISKRAVEDEKIRKKILKPFSEEIPIFTPLEKEDTPQKVIGQLETENKQISQELKKEIKEAVKKIKSEKNTRRPTMHLTNSKKRIAPRMFKQTHQNKKNLNGMDKINKLLGDRTIQSIECSGPGKNLIIKQRNKINVTQIVMTQEEINKVMAHFSQQARIPIVGGILKAAIGDLMISAISSQFVGSRFIINRETAYSLIDR